LGSIVQNGKLALWALACDKQLKRVDFPTLGNPTIPAFIVLNYGLQIYHLDFIKNEFLEIKAWAA
jgi:hypothetical protein